MSQDSKAVICSKKLKFKDWDEFSERVAHVAKNPNDMTPQEMLSSYFLNKVFWEKFGKGRHELFVRHWVIRKKIHNGTYKSNSGKRMGHFTPFFRIKNRRTGKIRHIGMGLLTMILEREVERGPNRRNDPKRNWGLPE
jgi:hypothetical protein